MAEIVVTSRNERRVRSLRQALCILIFLTVQIPGPQKTERPFDFGAKDLESADNVDEKAETRISSSCVSPRGNTIRMSLTEGTTRALLYWTNSTFCYSRGTDG